MLEKLEKSDRKLFSRVYEVEMSTGRLIVPETMQPWVEKTFGSVEKVSSQKIIKVYNKITFEMTLFNELRALRPLKTVNITSGTGSEHFPDFEENCSFCHPLDMTPEDMFGRIKTPYTITASNISKFEGFHSLIISKFHNPLNIPLELVKDYFKVKNLWLEKVSTIEPDICYPLFLWNCLWPAGSSIVHGHTQILASKDLPYSMIEQLRFFTEKYHHQYHSNYFDDIIEIHRKLGLELTFRTISILVHLTPKKEMELVFIGKTPQDSTHFPTAVYQMITAMKKMFNIQSFNFILIERPLRKTKESWEHFPQQFGRLVIRGSLQHRTSDIAAMELYSAAVVANDPFKVAYALKQFKSS